MGDDDSRAGMRYESQDLLSYLERVHASHDDALSAAFSSPVRDGLPAIMVGASEGRLLELLMRMIAARRVVEVGTLAGYSALRIARGLPDDGRLWSIEADPQHAEVARNNLIAGGVSDRVQVVVGRGLEVLPTLERHGPFDAVFIDADKENYPGYGAWALAHLRRGGLVIGDNANYFGNLLQDSPGGRAMRAFHEHIAEHCHSVCIPTGEGMLLGIKR